MHVNICILTLVLLSHSLQADDLDPEADMNDVEIIRYWGYAVEEFDVVTEDGYVLSLFRIPHGPASDGNASCTRPVVLMGHALACASTQWIMNPPESSPAFILADSGFDVFLMNYRGSTYGRRHATLSPDDNKFWQYTVDEIAKFDVSAAIDKVLGESGKKSLHWVGTSLGTLTGFMALAEHPEYNTKVTALYQVGPVGASQYMKGVSRWGKFLYSTLKPIASLYRLSFGSHEIVWKMPWLFRPIGSICNKGFLGREARYFCESLMGFLVGPTAKTFNWTRIPVYLSHIPAGLSTWGILHLAQMATNHRVEHMDHNPFENIRRYGQLTPPLYNYSAINVPVHYYWSRNDWVTPPEDIEQYLNHSLRTDLVKGGLEVPEYNHVDLAVATDCAEKVYLPIAKTMRSLENGDICTR